VIAALDDRAVQDDLVEQAIRLAVLDVGERARLGVGRLGRSGCDGRGLRRTGPLLDDIALPNSGMPLSTRLDLFLHVMVVSSPM
jgi:hypothetical protein